MVPYSQVLSPCIQALMEQNLTRIGLQPSVGTGYSVIFKVTEQEGEGDETTSQACEEEEGDHGAARRHTCALQLPDPEDTAELSQVELEGKLWAHG